MADVAPGLITNGLGGNCTNMMLGFFHLGSLEIIIGSPGEPPVPPQPPNAGGGGSSVRPYWPDRTDDWDIDNPRTITVKIRYKDKVLADKMYVVSSKRAEFIISVSNWVSKSRELIRVAVSNVRSKIAKVSIKNMKTKLAKVTAKYKPNKD
jgi:hypothetical protein